MKKLLAFWISIAVSGAVVAGAERIFTNPKPDAHLKRLFPNAVAFSSLAGAPLHFTAYSTGGNKKVQPFSTNIDIATVNPVVDTADDFNGAGKGAAQVLTPSYNGTSTPFFQGVDTGYASWRSMLTAGPLWSMRATIEFRCGSCEKK